MLEHSQKPLEVKALDDLALEFSDYFSAILYSVFDGVLKNIGVAPPPKPDIQKARNYKNIWNSAEKYKARLKKILGRYTSKKPDDLFSVQGRPLYKKNGRPYSVAEWEAFDRQVTDHVKPMLSSAAEELVVKTFLVGMANLEAGMQAAQKGETHNTAPKESFEKLEKEQFDGAAPGTIANFADRYELPHGLYTQAHLSYARVADWVTQADQTIKSAIRTQVISAYQKEQTPVKLASNLYWQHYDDPDLKNYTAEIISRDWRRVAYTETAMLAEQAKMAVTEDRAQKSIKGQSAPVYFVFGGSGRCGWCGPRQGIIVRQIPTVLSGSIATDNDSLKSFGIDDPYTDTAIWAGKNNVGRPKAKWWTCAPAHPFCGCRFALIDPSKQEYDAATDTIAPKVGALSFLSEGSPILKKIDSLNASIKRREDLMAADRAKGIHRRDSWYFNSENQI